jgi:hypothetical protein
LYRSAGDYADLVAESIPGNPEGLSAQTLHARAWEIVQPYFIKKQEDASARIRQHVGTGLARGDLGEIVPAAIQGRVETLFVATGQQLWGILNPAGDRVAFQEKAVAGSEDLLNRIAVETLMQGGQVYAVEPAQVPLECPAAALFRF